MSEKHVDKLISETARVPFIEEYDVETFWSEFGGVATWVAGKLDPGAVKRQITAVQTSAYEIYDSRQSGPDAEYLASISPDSSQASWPLNYDATPVKWYPSFAAPAGAKVFKVVLGPQVCAGSAALVSSEGYDFNISYEATFLVFNPHLAVRHALNGRHLEDWLRKAIYSYLLEATNKLSWQVISIPTIIQAFAAGMAQERPNRLEQLGLCLVYMLSVTSYREGSQMVQMRSKDVADVGDIGTRLLDPVIDDAVETLREGLKNKADPELMATKASELLRSLTELKRTFNNLTYSSNSTNSGALGPSASQKQIDSAKGQVVRAHHNVDHG